MRRMAGGAFVLLGAVLLLQGGFAAAAGPADPVHQEVAVAGSAPDEGVLVFGSRSRNDSCSVTRNVLNRSGAALELRVLDAGGAVLDERALAAGAQVTFVIDHLQVTVPLLLQVGGDAPVELAQVGPFPPCDAPATTAPPTTTSTTTVPTSPPTSAAGGTGGPTATTAAGPTVTTPAVATSVPPAPATGAPSLEAAAQPPAVTSTPTSLVVPPVSVLGAQVGGPTVGRLPTTGTDTRPTIVLGFSSLAVGAAFLLAGRTMRRHGR